MDHIIWTIYMGCIICPYYMDFVKMIRDDFHYKWLNITLSRREYDN